MLWIDVKRSINFILKDRKISYKVNDFLIKVSEEIFSDEFPRFSHFRAEDFDTFRFTFTKEVDFFVNKKPQVSFYSVVVSETSFNCRLVIDGKIIYTSRAEDTMNSSVIAEDITQAALSRLRNYANHYVSKKRKDQQKSYEEYIRKCTTYTKEQLNSIDEEDELHKCNHKWGCVCGEYDLPPGFATS